MHDRPRAPSRAPRLAFALLLGVPLLLAPRGCEEPGEPGTCFCDDRYQPVCGADGNTYGNACEADCAGVDVAREGPCGCEPIEPIHCEWGHVEDQRGCPTSRCLPPPACPPVLCDIYCEHGHVIDEHGCATCACNPPPGPLCLSSDECGEGAYCDYSECLSPCDDATPDDRACPAVCYGQCRSGEPPLACTSHADCREGSLCRDGVCVPREPPPPPACASDADCRRGELCFDGVCVPDEPPPPACESHADCREGSLCRDGVCVPREPPPPPACASDADCRPGWICFDGACVADEPPPPASCTSDADCRDDERCYRPMCWEGPELPPCPSEGTCGPAGPRPR